MSTKWCRFAMLFAASLSMKVNAFDIDFSGVVAPAIGVDSLPYRDTETEVYPSLLIMGNIGKLFIEGNRAGYVLNRSDFGAFSIVGQSRTHQYIPDSSALEERDKALEFGVQLAKPIGGGWSGQLTLFTDVSDTHKGQEIEIAAYRRDFFGDFRLLTLVALQQQNKDLTQYYAGTDTYKPDGDLNAELEFIGVYDITEDISAIAVFRHYFHGSGIDDSPLTDSNQTTRFMFGIGWSF